MEKEFVPTLESAKLKLTDIICHSRATRTWSGNLVVQIKNLEKVDSVYMWGQVAMLGYFSFSYGPTRITIHKPAPEWIKEGIWVEVGENFIKMIDEPKFTQHGK